MICFGIIGAGRIGKVHARTIAAAAGARVAAIADAVPEAASTLAREVGAATATVEDILADRGIDAVLIATPTPTHADLIERAAAAGKAILCEKPVSLSVDRISECLAVVEKRRTPLMIGFNRRFDPNFAALEGRVRAGAIGEIEMVMVTSRDPSPPPASYVKDSGGIFRDMMIHDLDMARFVMGEEFVTVQALGAALVDSAIGQAGDADTATVQMQTASGRIAVITNSRRAAYGYDQRIEVHGAKGMLRAGNVHASTVELASAGGFVADALLHFFTERYAAAYGAEVNAFIAALAAGTPMRPSGFDGLQAQRLADAATESWRSGAPVRLG